jgi:hypothetical protein
LDLFLTDSLVQALFVDELDEGESFRPAVLVSDQVHFLDFAEELLESSS